MSSALLTVVVMAVAAGITAGLLVLAGVGDDGKRSSSEAVGREERIDQVAERLAADIVDQSPEACDLINGLSNVNGSSNYGESEVFEVVVFSDLEPDYFAGLSDEDAAAVSGRFTEKLRAECEGGRE